MEDPRYQFHLSNMHCSSCVTTIENAVIKVPGVKEARVNFANKTLWVEGNTDPEKVVAAVKAAGYAASLVTDEMTEAHHHDSSDYALQFRQSAVAACAGLLLIADMFFQWLPPLSTQHFNGLWLVIGLLTLAMMWYSGADIYRNAWQALLKRSANMNSLVALGTGMAWLYSMAVILFSAAIPPLALHIYFDTTLMLLAFIKFGRALEARAQTKTSFALKQLMGLKPKTTTLIKDGAQQTIAIEEVGVGDVLLAKPGEKIAVDGVITKGHSAIDEAMISGEPLPVSKGVDDPVIAGTINQTASLEYRATAIGKDTVLSQIIRMVEQAQSSKPNIGRMADRIASIFVPVVIVIAIITGIIWALFGPSPKVAYVLITTVSVLVIACPCAVGLATPISIMLAIGRAAVHGILVRNGQVLEVAEKIDTVVFDKTGTLTEGKPTVVKCVNAGNQALLLAMNLEMQSEHPLATAIVSYVKDQVRELEKYAVENFVATSGKGASAMIDGQKYFIGNKLWMTEHAIDLDNLAWQSLADMTHTLIFFSDDKKLLAVFAISDPIRKTTAAAIKQFHEQGLKLVLLSGDRRVTANAIAASLGIDEVIAEVLPQDKAAEIKKLQTAGAKVAMVGDGINDAPALSQADVGIAVGNATDIAMASADVTLLSQSLASISWLMNLSRLTMRNIKQNLWGAFIYNVLGIPIAAGILYPWFHILLNPLFAGGAMALSSLTVVLNALRLRSLVISSTMR